MTSFRADYLVVGGGAAGCVLAARLSEDPAVSVLLLESGPPDTGLKALGISVPAGFAELFESPFDWAFRTQPEAGMDKREIFWPRGRVLGGSSSINAQMYVRGVPADYDGWDVPGWSWDDVLPLFKRSEANVRGASAWHGADGPQPVNELRDPSPLTLDLLRAAWEAGVPRNNDVNGPVQEGAGLVQVTQRGGRRASAAGAFLRPAMKRPNLRVLTGSTAQRVVVEDGRAVAVDVARTVRGRTELRRVTAGREIVLTAGAIGSPHLLQRSGIGAADELTGAGITPLLDRPGVGANLQDHLAAGIRADVSTPISLSTAKSPKNLVRFLLSGRGPLTSNIGEGLGFIRTVEGLPAADLELIFAPVHFADEGLIPPTRHGVTVASILLRPYSRGRISTVSPDAGVPPRIEANYLSDPRDLPPLVHGLKLGRRILAEPAFAAHRPVETDPGPAAQGDDALAAHIRAQGHTLYHPVGTCRMGTDADSVVDPELRVRGVAGLRVADASVMPEIIRGHTYAPTVMIAEKAADLLRR